MLKVKQKKKEIDLYDAAHPARALAIRVIEEVIEPIWKPLKGEVYYNIEDAITVLLSENVK